MSSTERRRTEEKNIEWMNRARGVIPGGVNSPVRAFASVGGHPPFIAHGTGATLVDVDGNEYLDYVGSWGPLLFGHADPDILEAVHTAAERGTSFGAPTEAEVELAERVIRLVPSIEKVRLVNSGTEATMSAVRLARGVTGRPRFVKFTGGYHGHGDAFLIQAGSGAATLGVPSSPGVPEGTARDTLAATYNDVGSVEALFEQHPGEIACVIVEPIAGNMGCVPPADGFLEGLRGLCDKHGALLIFDEVMTGFRVAPGGAQERFGVRPDLTTLGKIMGGGLPLAAYGGRADLMEQIAPHGPVYQAGTLSGNPLATAAGNAMLKKIETTPTLYDQLEARAIQLRDGLAAALEETHTTAVQANVGAMSTLFFSGRPVHNWDDADACDRKAFARFFHNMLDRGIYLAPSQFECGFISAVHTEEDIERTIQAARESLEEAREHDR